MENMLENTNSGTNYQLQGTIYRLIRSTLRRLFVEGLFVEGVFVEGVRRIFVERLKG